MLQQHGTGMALLDCHCSGRMVLVKAIAAFTSAIPARYRLGSKGIHQDDRLDDPSGRVAHTHSDEKEHFDQ